MPEFRILVKDHIPFTKLSHQVKNSVCEMRVNDYDGTESNPNAWLELSLSEQYQLESGRVQSKTISVTLNARQRDQLLKSLLAAQK